MEKPKYLLIDSRDRISGSSHDFKIQLKPALTSVKSIKLLSVGLPLTNYIVDSTNNKIYFNDGTTDFTATLSNGVYDSDSILSAIKTAMEATGYGGVITVTYSDITLKFTITSTLNISLSWGTTENSAAYLFGFNNVNTINTATHTSDNVPHLSIPPYIFIDIDAFPIVTSTSNAETTSFIIFSHYNSGSVSFHTQNTHYEIKLTNRISQLQYFNVKLKYRGGNILNLNGIDWQFLLEIDY